MTPISVSCLTFNSQRTIRQTLESVAQVADEIIVVDSHSTDGTIEIVKEFTEKIFYRDYTYHGLQMNYAIDCCTHDWVFCIDSDEYLDDEMTASLLALKRHGLQGKEAFRLHRRWYFLGRPVHALYPISSPDKIVRFFDRRTVRFNERPVHDKPTGFTNEDWLGGMLVHDSVASLHELYDKMNRYTTRHARGFAADASGVSLLKVLVNPVGAFLKWYFLKKNFLDGFRGLALGTYAAMYTHLKYAKLYEIRTNIAASDGKR